MPSPAISPAATPEETSSLSLAMIHRRFLRLLERIPRGGRSIIRSCVYGLAAGLSAVAFQLAIAALYHGGLLKLASESKSIFVIGSLALMVLTTLCVGILLNVFCPAAAGSGIPQLKLAFWKDFGVVPWRIAWVKFIAGALSIGGGSSLGREGPSVQLAGVISSNLAGLTGEPKQNRRLAAASGAAAGLAAAFNAPLAATAFVLEEIIGDLNSRLLGSVVLASVLGALVVQAIIGKQPAFTLASVSAPTWMGYVLTPVVAALATIVGVYFQRFSLGLRRFTQAQSAIPAWLTPMLGGLIAWALGVAVFLWTGSLGVFSLGYDDLSRALTGKLAGNVALILLAAKFIATFCCYGFGGCGGIFSPCLFFGGMVGIAFSELVGLHWGPASADILTLAVVGMSATLGGVVGAPVTGILIVFEMTHEFSLVPALMIGAIVSQTISRKFNRENFYDALLEQDGQIIERIRPPRDLQSWQETPLTALVKSRPVAASHASPEALRQLLKSNPYERFPVLKDGVPVGVLTRPEAAAALAANREPRLEPVTTCRSDQTVGELQKLLIQSPTNFVVVVDGEGKMARVITLHDLLRAEIERSGG